MNMSLRNMAVKFEKSFTLGMLLFLFFVSGLLASSVGFGADRVKVTSRPNFSLIGTDFDITFANPSDPLRSNDTWISPCLDGQSFVFDDSGAQGTNLRCDNLTYWGP
jgi:hypothetical protein